MNIKIGTSGFSFPDWVGTVYPAEIKKKEMFDYYVKKFPFNAVEINVSYYQIVSPSVYNSFIEKTDNNFEFIIKAYKGITHDIIERGTWKFKENDDVTNMFFSTLFPLKSGGKLGGILFQFPPYFFPKNETLNYLKKIKIKSGDVPMFLEFRNRYWDKDEYLQFIKDNDMNLCSVDLPKFEKLPSYKSEPLGKTAYFRFHGRNQKWYEKGIDRYDYLYSEDELLKFKEDILITAQKVRKVFVFFNNCHAGKAVTNANMLVDLLKEGYNN